MRLRWFMPLLLAASCVQGFNKVALKHWYPPPDNDTTQLCTGERAKRCTDDALKLIDASTPEKQPDRAARLLGAACEQDDARACSTLDSRFTPPKRLNPIEEYGVGMPHASDSYGEIACTVTVEGEAIKCRSLRNGGHNASYTEALLKSHFSPAKLDGEPFESEYIERYYIRAY